MKKLSLLLLSVILFSISCAKEKNEPAKEIDKIWVRGLTVKDFPATEANGAGWDILDGPDLYFTILHNNTLIYTHPQFVEDATPNQNHFFDIAGVLYFEAPKERYTVTLWDYDDFDADDQIGGIEFTPYDERVGFIEEIPIKFGEIEFTLTVDYLYK